SWLRLRAACCCSSPEPCVRHLCTECGFVTTALPPRTGGRRPITLGESTMKSPSPARLALAIHVALLLSFSGLAAAQDAPADTPQARTLDTVTVTGTRIKKAELESQVPIQVLSREDIDRSGFTSVADIVQNLTASGAALNTKFNSSGNFGFPPDGGGVGAGAATVDLRHLGAKRVLVLVDGVRWVNESSASGVGSSVDLNTIPLSIIDRIEVLEDGASSIYGSDAIAGVVN